eukprot:CAMPEP_0198132050 /NCGR_PEP_ID=MMETSP1442-20131203/57541_1 /TAXON_ID= /ORGANISM="Craspedostauros australis, Strain CCMP3328" /LENGTH=40 /DNA_ID= /DNA_START= /DNA_END= /DNA_ORIENTATION=
MDCNLARQMTQKRDSKRALVSSQKDDQEPRAGDSSICVGD